MTYYSRNPDEVSAADRRELEEALADLDLGPGPFAPDVQFTSGDLAEMARYDAAFEAHRRGHHPRADPFDKPGTKGFFGQRLEADRKRTDYHKTKAAAGESVRPYQWASDMSDDELADHKRRQKSEENRRAYLARKARSQGK